MVLLDSCFLIDLFAEDAGAVAKIDELEWETASVSALTVTEVGRGLSDVHRERFESIIERVDVRPYDLSEAKRATTEHRRLQQEGRPIGAVDAMIAATAIEANKPVVTRNVAEFQRTNAEVTPY